MLTLQARACLMGRVYLLYYNNDLVCKIQALTLLTIIFFYTRINLAAGAIHAPDPASESVNETETISDADQSMEQTSTEDEDPNEEVVNDLDVFAEVKLPSTIH